MRVEIMFTYCIMVQKYKDNNVVKIALNHAQQILVQQKGIQWKRKKDVQHQQPVAIKNSNTHMGE